MAQFNQIAEDVCKSHKATFVQISAMGDPEGNAKGGFLILDQDLKVPSSNPSLTRCPSSASSAAVPTMHTLLLFFFSQSTPNAYKMVNDEVSAMLLYHYVCFGTSADAYAHASLDTDVLSEIACIDGKVQ